MTLLDAPPRFSIITPVYDTDPELLAQTVDSVTRQTERSWELILVDDKSPSEATRTALARIGRTDPRIHVIWREVNGRIAEATNTGLAAATGEYVVLLDHDDILVPHALERIDAELTAHPETDYLYTDEDKIDEVGEAYGAFAKPDWSPSRLLTQMYTSHASVFRRTLIDDVGLLRSEFDGSQDHDLVLRAVERAKGVRHVPEVLYHWRAVLGSTAIDVREKDYAWDAGLRAVQDALDRRQLAATAEPGGLPGTYRIRWRQEAIGFVSLIVTSNDERTSNGTPLVVEALHSVLGRKPTHPVEVVLVHGPEMADSTLAAAADIPGTVLVPVLDTAQLGRSARSNLGFAHATHNTLVFLDEHIRATTDTLLLDLAGPLSRPGVGATAPRTLDSTGHVRDAGFRYALNDYRRPYVGRESDDSGEANALFVDREVSAVSSSCLAIHTDTFARAGGFSQHLQGDAADLDFGRKLVALGLTAVWLASAEVVDLRESPPATPTSAEFALLAARWGGTVDDPYIG